MHREAYGAAHRKRWKKEAAEECRGETHQSEQSEDSLDDIQEDFALEHMKKAEMKRLANSDEG